MRLYCFNNPSEPNRTAHSFPIPLVSLRVSMRFRTKKILNFQRKTEAFFFPASLESTIQDPQALNKGAQSRLGKKESSDWIRLEVKKETYLNIEKRNFQREKKTTKNNNLVQAAFNVFRIWLYMKADQSVMVFFEDSYK